MWTIWVFSVKICGHELYHVNVLSRLVGRCQNLIFDVDFQGDRVSCRISVGDGCTAAMTTQASTKVSPFSTLPIFLYFIRYGMRSVKVLLMIKY